MSTGARVIRLPRFSDDRGSLVVAEVDAELPFVPLRAFMVTDVPAGSVRGRHAHRHCAQLVVVLRGSCRVTLVDATGRQDVVLDSPERALFIPPMVWAEQADFAPGTSMLVLASEKYDPQDYLRSMPEFLRLVGAA